MSIQAGTKKQENTITASSVEHKEQQLYTSTEYKQFAPEQTITMWSFMQSLFVPLLCIGILAYLLVAIKKKGFRNIIAMFGKKHVAVQKKESLIIKQRYQIDQKKYFFVVQFLDEHMLLGVTDMGVSVIAKESSEGNISHAQNVEKFDVLMGNLEKE